MWHGAKNLAKKIAAVSVHSSSLIAPLRIIMLSLLCIAINNGFNPYTQAAQVKELSVLLLWLKDIVNHFWWCCKTADSYEEFLVSFVSFLPFNFPNLIVN